jgi:hypothetical protein
MELIKRMIRRCDTRIKRENRSGKSYSDQAQDVFDAYNETLNINHAIDWWTLLHYSTMSLDTQCTKYLLDCGANPNYCADARGTSPFAFALTTNNYEIIELLIRNEANVCDVDSDGKLLFYKTLEIPINKLPAARFAKLFLDFGATELFKDDYAARDILTIATINQRKDIIEHILSTQTNDPANSKIPKIARRAGAAALSSIDSHYRQLNKAARAIVALETQTKEQQKDLQNYAKQIKCIFGCVRLILDKGYRPNKPVRWMLEMMCLRSTIALLALSPANIHYTLNGDSFNLLMRAVWSTRTNPHW